MDNVVITTTDLMLVCNNANGEQVTVPVPASRVNSIESTRRAQVYKQEILNSEQEEKEWALAVMEQYGIDSMEINGVTFTKKRGHTRTNLNSKLVKETAPDVWEACSQTVTVKPTVVVDHGY